MVKEKGHWEGNWFIKPNGQIDWDKTNSKAIDGWASGGKPTGMEGVELISDEAFNRIRSKELAFGDAERGIRRKNNGFP